MSSTDNEPPKTPKYVDVIASVIATLVLIGITVGIIVAIIKFLEWAF